VPLYYFVVKVKVRIRVTLRLAVYANQFVSASSTLRLTTRDVFLLQLNTCGHSPYVTSSDEWMGLSFTIASGSRQRSHSRVRVLRDSWTHFSVSDSRLPQPGGPGTRIYIPQDQGGPVIPPGTGYPFSRLLRLAGLRWRYSNPPPHGATTYSFLCTLIIPWHVPRGKHLLCYQECVFIDTLPSKGWPSKVVSVTPGMCLSSRCLAMVMCHITSLNIWELCKREFIVKRNIIPRLQIVTVSEDIHFILV
jgi:hypothetical protein